MLSEAKSEVSQPWLTRPPGCQPGELARAGWQPARRVRLAAWHPIVFAFKLQLTKAK